jgi:hypothetical protein
MSFGMEDNAVRAADKLARVGLAARTLFYLLLAALVVSVAVDHGHGGQQANAHGALSLIARNPVGYAAIIATAVGFFVLGVVRIFGAVRDRKVDNWRRATTALQGAFYVALTWVPVSFALGRRQTGSEQQQHEETAKVLSWPFGRELVAIAGVIAICLWQIRSALTRGFDDGLDLRGQPRWVQRFVNVVGVVGIAARALVFLPIGAFLIVAAVESDPQHADGLDAELGRLAQHWWGPAALAAVAAGLVIFALYSGAEARFRDVERGV